MSKTFDLTLMVPGKTWRGVVADSVEDAQRQVEDDPLVEAYRKASEPWMLVAVELNEDEEE